MEIVPIDEEGRLLLSSDIDDWAEIEARGISVIVDLDHTLDAVPSDPDRILYLYYPFEDRELPSEPKLHAIARLIADLKAHKRILVHCRMGYNRSALVMGLALTYLGFDGATAVAHLRERRPGALFNETFAAWLEQQPAKGVTRFPG